MPPNPAPALMRGPLMGTIFAMLLYGVMSLQSHLYFLRYPKDPLSVKILVATIWVLETVHVVLSIHFIEHYLIRHFGDVLALTKVEWSLATAAMFGFVIGLLVNLFFVWRIWLLSRNMWISILIATLSSTRFAFGILACWYGLPYDNWADFRVHAYPFILSGLSLGVVVDCLITYSVSYQLIKGRTKVRRTNAMINRLLFYTVNTGAVTSLFAILEIITFLKLPKTLTFLSFVSVQSKLYANCLLSTLNARKNLRANLPLLHLSTNSDVGAIPISKFSAASRGAIPSPRIEISTETVVETDLEDRCSPSPDYGQPYSARAI